MSASIGDIASLPIVSDAAHAAPVRAPEPSGPPTSSSSAAVSGSGSTSSTANADGSITTVVTDALGDTLSVSTSAPALDAGTGAHPHLSFEA